MSTDRQCESCEEVTVTHYCVSCDSHYCDPCWKRQGPHRPGKVGQDGLPHEKTDLNVVEALRDILSPPSSVAEQDELHREDLDTTWFGVVHEDNVPVFQNYDRYASVMADSLCSDTDVRYPQLVSFIGQTGAGKSTLVKMLINHQGPGITDSSSKFPSPVVGSAINSTPTSADVHLYADPGTYYQQRPLLYADCEGLEGGERDPLAEKHKAADDRPALRARQKSKPVKKLQKAARCSRIEWATTPEKRKRQFAVTQLYPRVLYTFSDVIVFVLRNSKTFEAVLEKLLNWASASIEKSLNQPLLPHAIIALNATENSIDPSQWTVKEATQRLLSDIDDSIALVPQFANYAEYWRNRGKKIKSMKDLIECFYSSVTVVRIPTKGRYMLINEQVEKLHQEIVSACNNAYIARQKARMLCDADGLQIYLQSAFDHFSRDLDTPFNFIEVSLKNNPIPLDFRGNILKLALAIRDWSQDSIRSGPRIFKILGPMVASCIMLDFARQKYQGTATELFDKHYLHHCFQALEDFCAFHWCCHFANRSGKCVNTRAGHAKGHQNERGKSIAGGEFESSFSADSYCEIWKMELQDNVREIEKTLQREIFGNPSFGEEAAAHKLHLHRLNDFYGKFGSAYKVVSHSTCFCCLRELPEHALPCGHVLCTPCINSYGIAVDKYCISMWRCPLHTDDTVWKEPYLVRLKPPHAGVRILTLDGGGFRGIVELEVLKAVERTLGGKIPIQAFFDLIVGTSTGGIIALGLGVQGWSVDSCIDKFKSLCGRAFSPRDFRGIPGFRKLAFVHHHAMYKTRPFVGALCEAFGEARLFGGLQDSNSYQTKVAVTSATGTGQQAVVISNYNRPRNSDDQQGYRYERPDKPDLELKVWEAARATSAAPKYFKPFLCERTGNLYWDGALYHNNPVNVANHERKLLWPDTANSHPDIVLSIGSGSKHYLNTTEESRDRLRKSPSPSSTYPPHDVESNRVLVDWARKPKWTHLWTVLVNRVRDVLDSDRIWESFLLDVAEPQSLQRERYIRLNIDLGFDPPALDAVDQLDNVQTAARDQLYGAAPYKSQIQQIAARLVASCFFFDKTAGSLSETDSGFQVSGAIYCRFGGESASMRALGDYLRLQQTPDFQPYFSIEERYREAHAQRVIIRESVIYDMISRARFNMEPVTVHTSKQAARITISLYLKPEQGFAISGFPRSLIVEESLKLTHQKSPPVTPRPIFKSEYHQHSATSSKSSRSLSAPIVNRDVYHRSNSYPFYDEAKEDENMNGARVRSVTETYVPTLHAQASSILENESSDEWDPADGSSTSTRIELLPSQNADGSLLDVQLSLADADIGRALEERFKKRDSDDW
ncbi:hypothetical protein W97_01652 [Coniosporium apollinis CBS 100218]|uniref:PNPLA domain-containing protein n=1 Tax=Coniosporium apollinis (strain CBS 100218) TaxID=1168221 RepID=R7YKJ7_CONA1|nr:uncharacterized protein W97_01652 [Coniosporium apollinis CBS 100218]EON62430.1 hypothetical protein W97_01652 [Coniosporium apollinis CBS 100218]